MTLKEIKESADGFGAITNKEQLKAAVPVIVEALERIKCMSATMRKVGEAVGKLNDKASKYALEHPSVFDDGLHTQAKGVITGDLTFDDKTYHFAAGYADPRRIDGDAMSQDFLAGLPKEWVQDKLHLYTTGINQLGVTCEQLEDKGLFRPAKNVWTFAGASSTAEDCGE